MLSFVFTSIGDYCLFIYLAQFILHLTFSIRKFHHSTEYISFKEIFQAELLKNIIISSSVVDYT